MSLFPGSINRLQMESSSEQTGETLRAALEAARAAGYAEAMDRDRGTEMLGGIGLYLIGLLCGFAAAWSLFA